MGDAYVDVITDEEKAILQGEDPKPPAPDAEKDEPDKGPDTPAVSEGETLPEGEKVETEQTQEEKEQQKQAEEMGLEVVTDEKSGKQYIVDEDGARIPPQRFSKIYRDAKEGERTKDKLDLFKKLGPDGYYQAYPDERPAAPLREEPRRDVIPAGTDIGALIVKQPNGPYDGMTLRDVYQQDPVFATNLQTDFLLKQREVEDQRKGEAGRVKQEAATEIETFAESVSQEVFGKSARGLSKDEEAKITGTIQQVIDWMHQTHRGGGNINDAYFLMNKEGLLKGAANKAAAKTLKDLQGRKGPASIDTGSGGEVKETGFEAVEKMTATQLENYIDGLDEKATTRFLTKAPKSLRAKLPSMPWKTAA
jgi:hypothetical protein